MSQPRLFAAMVAQESGQGVEVVVAAALNQPSTVKGALRLKAGMYGTTTAPLNLAAVSALPRKAPGAPGLPPKYVPLPDAPKVPRLLATSVVGGCVVSFNRQ